jgi:hypothetical protein
MIIAARQGQVMHPLMVHHFIPTSACVLLLYGRTAAYVLHGDTRGLPLPCLSHVDHFYSNMTFAEVHLYRGVRPYSRVQMHKDFTHIHIVAIRLILWIL